MSLSPLFSFALSALYVLKSPTLGYGLQVTTVFYCSNNNGGNNASRSVLEFGAAGGLLVLVQVGLEGKGL